MKTGKIKFEDILGNKGKIYDIWLDKQLGNYYLTYKQNFYSDKFDFSIEREGCGASEPIFLAKTIEEITNKIDKEIRIEKRQQRKSELAKNPDNYILDNVCIDKSDFESEKSYITFALGYDLLIDMIKKYDVLECDTNYEFCNNLAKQFLNSNEYSNFSHSSYEMLQEWLSKNMTEIEKSYKEKIGFKDKIYNDNMVILDKGFRKNSPIALVEKTLNENEKEYIIAFNYKINEDKLSWGYAYYYDNDSAKAENDYKKVVSGKSLYNTFDKKDERF